MFGPGAGGLNEVVSQNKWISFVWQVPDKLLIWGSSSTSQYAEKSNKGNNFDTIIIYYVTIDFSSFPPSPFFKHTVVVSYGPAYDTIWFFMVQQRNIIHIVELYQHTKVHLGTVQNNIVLK